jgi:hypothetical protein
MKGLWRSAVVLAMLAATGWSSGCLQKDVTHTWYLDGAAGTVRWSVLEDHVRSDARAAADRADEELAYLLAVQRDDHTVVRAFRQFGFMNSRTRVLRDTVPFTVLTDVAASRIDVVGERIILYGGLAGTSVLTTSDGLWDWTLSLRDPQASGGPQVSDDVSDLLNGLDHLAVVLVDGVFVDAAGFTLSGDRRSARLHMDADGDAAPAADGAPMVWRLRWRR